MSRSGICSLCLILVFIGACATVQAAEKDLAAYWAFEEGKEKFVEDLSGNGNTGNINGPFEWVEGIIGNAIEFEGTTTVNCGMGESLRIDQDITTELWVKPTRKIDGKNARINVLYMHWGPMFAFSLPNGPGALAFWVHGPVPTRQIYSKAKEWEEDTWYYIVGSYDGSASRLYVNAELQGTFNNKGDILERDMPLVIGENYFGIVDEVKIHSRGLSEQEITKNYRFGLTGGEAVDASGKLPLTWGQIRDAF